MGDFFKKNKILAIIFFVVILFLVLFLSKNYFYKLNPAFTFFAKSGEKLSSNFRFISSISETKKENSALREQLLELKVGLAELKEIEKENENLRKELDLIPQKDFDLMASFVIGGEMSGQGQLIFIDKGRSDGIEEGKAVIVGKGVLIGKIIKVEEGRSAVQLLTDKNSKVNVEIIETESRGILKGAFGTSARIEMLPQQDKIEANHTIITSGLGENFPRGLLIGYVKETFLAEDKLFQNAEIIFPRDIKNNRVVFVIK